MPELQDKIITGDCIKILNKVRKPFADLIFADPPFNIGYKYDKYKDTRKKEHYVNWSSDWMSACWNLLKPHGSFYIAIGDEHAADIKKIADDLNLYMRNWLIWHYSFGQQMKNKFSRSHTHILYFVKDKKNFTFNDGLVRIISDRQKKYNDKRANPEGKMPDDVWDEYPRICGTFKERTNFPCQMPESLLARIIRFSSNEDDWVLDPFSGSGTTCLVAKKLKRKFTGIEISKKYANQSRKRLQQAETSPHQLEQKTKWPANFRKELKWLYQENKIPIEQLLSNKNILNIFTSKFRRRIVKNRKIPITPIEIKTQLKNLQNKGALGVTSTRTEKNKNPVRK